MIDTNSYCSEYLLAKIPHTFNIASSVKEPLSVFGMVPSSNKTLK